MPPAARITDTHTCPGEDPGPVPHVGGPVVAGCVTVRIGYMPAARLNDALVCVGPPAAISAGSPTVNIGNMAAARLGDPTSHGGIVESGCPTVIIGPTVQSESLSAASSTGAPFCEECERAKEEIAAEQELQ